ncbi:MAG TPA: hypothetical protein VGI06_07195 [Acidimicrobiales bacterium]
MASPLGRRAFLGLSGLGLVGAAVPTAVLAACSSGGGGGGSDLVALPNDWEFLSGRPYRLGVLLASQKHNGAPVTMNSPVTVRVAAPGGGYGPPIPLEIHGAGPEPTYAQTMYTFPAPGNYTLEVAFKGQKTTSPIQVITPAQSSTPVVGAQLPSVPTPTVTAPAGVNPICTQQPPCPFHATSLDAALAAHRPVVLQFATPAFCQSKFCGPVLLNLQAAAKPWGSRVTFIHCEIYRDDHGPTNAPDGNLAPAVAAYNLQHEPMLYLADTRGVVVDRIDNLYDQVEARSALTRAFGAGTLS